MERLQRYAEHCAPSTEFSPQFKYTVDPNQFTNSRSLTIEQREFYEANGFIVIRKLLTPQEIHVLTNHFKKICNGETEPLIGMSIMRDISVANTKTSRDSRIITKIQDWQDDDVLFGYCKNEKILDYVENFTGPNIRSIHTMIIQKPVVTNAPSSRHPLHQDLVYFPFRPADRIVCSWTCMEERISRENGGLVVVPGSHKPPVGLGDIYKHTYPSEWERVNKLYYGIDMDEKLQKLFDSHKVYLDMEMGDTVFFHPLLIHGSGANKSTKYGFRKAISCHYAGAECSGISDMTGSPQEEIAKEVVDLANSRYGASGFDINFLKIWLFKSRQVRGSLPDDPNNVFVQYEQT